MPTDTLTCDHCDDTATHHKYDERLCTDHFYSRWREVYGL